VKSKSGEVTLNGTVRNQAARKEIEQIAKMEPGVSDVNDEITIEGQVAALNSGQARLTSPPPTQASPPPPPPPPPPVVLPTGTVLTIRTNQALSTKTLKVGATFTGSVMTPITVDGKMVIPAGSDVTGVVKEVQKAGKFKGAAVLSLALDSVHVKGHTYNVVTELFDQKSKGKGKRTIAMVGGGAGAGAAIGAAAGGGTGAAVGAVVGAGVGTVGAMTGNRDIELPAESALSFQLDQPLTLKPDLES